MLRCKFGWGNVSIFTFMTPRVALSVWLNAVSPPYAPRASHTPDPGLRIRDAPATRHPAPPMGARTPTHAPGSRPDRSTYRPRLRHRRYAPTEPGSPESTPAHSTPRSHPPRQGTPPPTTQHSRRGAAHPRPAEAEVKGQRETRARAERLRSFNPEPLLPRLGKRALLRASSSRRAFTCPATHAPRPQHTRVGGGERKR